METKELKITIPENHEIDWQESARQERIIFKKKDTKPRSWEEYCEQYKNIPCYTLGYDVSNGYWIRPSGIYEDGYCTIPSKELAKAFLAMMQLMSLKEAWIGDWKPDWNDSSIKWCIVSKKGEVTVDYFYSDSHPLTFPTQEMALDFINCFNDLLEIAKPLL